MKEVLLKPQAAATLEALYQMALKEGRDEKYIKLNKHNHPEGVFMPLTFEVLYTLGNGVIVSAAHYYERNCELIPDPDMTFFRSNEKDIDTDLPMWMPVSFQDGFRYQEAIIFEDGVLSKYNRRLVASLISFSSLWMKNIRYQQGVKMVPYTKQESKAKRMRQLYNQAATFAKEMGYSSINEVIKAGKYDELQQKLGIQVR